MSPRSSRRSNVDATGRSRKESGWHKVSRFMLKSPAWADLNVYDRAVYLAFLTVYDGFNNGAIALGARDAAKLAGCNKDTANAAIHRLIARGFLTETKQAGFSCKVRIATEYRLNAYDCNVTGQGASKDFMRWRPGADDGPTRRDRRSHQTGQCASTIDKQVPPRRTVEAG